jgi:tetratricopeptide (TPR) repeat protein
MRAVRQSLAGAFVVLLLALGVAAVAAARWTRPVAEGDAALAARDWPRALDAYARAEARFDRAPAVRQLFARDHARAVGAQLAIAYHLERYDDVIDKAQRAPEAASPHFWSGLAYLAKGRADGKPEGQLGHLTRAEEELRRAVEADPFDWDTKYDYELVTRLAAGLRKQPKIPPNQLMQLLRQPPKIGAKPTRRVG